MDHYKGCMKNAWVVAAQGKVPDDWLTRFRGVGARRHCPGHHCPELAAGGQEGTVGFGRGGVDSGRHAVIFCVRPKDVAEAHGSVRASVQNTYSLALSDTV